MAEFLSPLVMSPVDSGRRWRIQSPLAYQSDVPGVLAVWVPPGFVCDLSSMPRLTWIVAPKTDYPEAGVLHDWLYQGHAPRKAADMVYREALMLLGMSKVKAQGRYVALRMFGWAAYKGTKEQAA
jgi:hypothetical protein